MSRVVELTSCLLTCLEARETTARSHGEDVKLTWDGGEISLRNEPAVMHVEWSTRPTSKQTRPVSRAEPEECFKEPETLGCP